MDAGLSEKRSERIVPRGSGMSFRMSLALLFAAASFVFVAAYTYGHMSFRGGTDGPLCPLEGKEKATADEDRALALPDDEGDGNIETEERPGGAGTTTGSTTGQRVAGHLLAVLLLASVTAAIVEAVRARMARPATHKTAETLVAGVPESHYHAPNTGGRTSRRGTLQEKSYSYDGYIYRSRSSSVGVSNQQVGVSTSAEAAASRAQKAIKVRMGGRTGGTPPLLRRSSFPVMSRTISRGDSNGGSPALGSRKPSISDIADDELGDLQKKRVRLIRRF
ncbi:uncharacterized protein [Hetaerina americana]|uniref:uncharacterized protein n=1 Tax=Hetaerina americana TaxID=62018 RepID=UPI003A7F1B20